LTTWFLQKTLGLDMRVLNLEMCEGRCVDHDECCGQVQYLNVSKDGKDWGNFIYCETARKSDLENGFILTEVEHK